MNKITFDFVKKQYRSGIKSYSDFTKEVGLWESEKYVFQKYLKTTDQILDLGCGTGRTTFPLYQLGYENIIGVDLTPEMINEANALNQHFKTDIDFSVGDAMDLKFEEDVFDSVIFSFNGIMSIPKHENRMKAFKDIGRVLKQNGNFIFTTHDRDAATEYLDYWKEEAVKWQNGKQNENLFEFGDLITQSRNETDEIFVHIPNRQEIENLLEQIGFEILETFYRSEKFDEPDLVKAKSGGCRFWVAKNS